MVLSFFNGADDGARTRYLHLGKVALYQMSYIRIFMVPPDGIEPSTRGFSVPCSTMNYRAIIGGSYRARTCDPLLVRQMLSQLS